DVLVTATKPPTGWLDPHELRLLMTLLTRYCATERSLYCCVAFSVFGWSWVVVEELRHQLDQPTASVPAPPLRHGQRMLGCKLGASAELLRESDEDALWPADVAEAVRILVLGHVGADELRAVLAEPG